jgi:site-specific DNA-methyltransferase (adenine-specific)
MTVELRQGRWQDVLQDVESVDAVITDPPYGAQTHAGQRLERDPRYSTARNPSALQALTNRGFSYNHWTPGAVRRFVQAWAPRTRGWFCAMTSDDLIHVYKRSLAKAGRYVFRPLPIIIDGMNVRLAGDGPSSESVWMIVARPRSREFSTWGTLRGRYIVTAGGGWDRAKLPVAGAKPLDLMRMIVRDYTRPGDLVCDPCAGGGTTLIAAKLEGRRAIGAEADPDTYNKAQQRLAYCPETEWQPGLFGQERP